MDYAKVGKIISRKRKQKKMTKKELAEILNVDKECITHWEKGKCLPFIEKMNDISKALDISLSDLMGNDKFVANNRLASICYSIMIFGILVAISYNSPLFKISLVLFFVASIFFLFKEIKKLYN